jgi:hypothetical protein
MNEQTNFDWGALGEPWWKETGAACRATEHQIKFACARHQGANKTKSAALAGYSGSAEDLRSAGVRAAGTKAVEDLLVLAAASEGGGDANGPATDAEIDRKLTKLIRSPDGAISLKAIEARDKRLAVARRAADSGAEGSWEDDTRALLAMRNGLGMCSMAFLGVVQEYAPRLKLSGIPLFEQLAPSIAQTYPDLWQKIRALLDSDCRADADRMAAAAATPIAELVPKTETAPAAEEVAPSAATA